MKKKKEISGCKYLSVNIRKFACVISEVKVILVNMYLPITCLSASAMNSIIGVKSRKGPPPYLVNFAF